MQDFRKLNAWEKGHALALKVYKATATFPRSEIYGLTSQMRRACVSIAANIAEGCGTRTDAEFVRFLGIAIASASELEYQLLLARDLGLLETHAHDRLSEQTTEVKRMVASLIKKVSARTRREL